ncbi:MAG: class I SAM-dependent methyltransferase [Verrucomicrobiae bacterium]|nr:class I SAM-dependent methyltransferase [Verrucomicrobiae bacterium]
MGLDPRGIRFLLYAKTRGVSFRTTAMIGRQRFFVGARKFQKILAEFGHRASADEIGQMLTESQGYAEPFLKWLGAEQIRSLDASDYERATDIVDLNQPIAETLKQQFSLVLDGGTLEHVFDFPTAIRNCMEMVACGGHFIGITPANNYLGHGFYQFSPELFFRIFSEQNGFRVMTMAIVEIGPWASWYEVRDPQSAGQRAELVNARPTYLFVLAERTQVVPIFSARPHQSDYVEPQRLHDPTVAPIKSWLPVSVRAAYGALCSVRKGGLFHRYDPKVFTKMRMP